ncbi:YafY family protein [Azospirillum sp. B4]|uniref:helix-turn-helix transcriptional regulator n=1 Tax=Azospirillum sp. B4 TaxID=95605 RepID=UPI00034B5E14|nr:HTH domain-containing protein [Azospirillum sp. B4]
MRRADRLFQIIQILRRTRRPLTADAIAAELETSRRTVYRDIADLMAQRVPIRGEAGIGYVLDEGYDLPPLMLTPDEIEAAVLGAQWVSTQGDPPWRVPPRIWSPKSPPRGPTPGPLCAGAGDAHAPPFAGRHADGPEHGPHRRLDSHRPQDPPELCR